VAIQVIDAKYEIVKKLGEGGMGAVYEARHLGTGRRVAVKVIVGEGLAKNAEVVARFQREARATGEIESQHIAHIFDTGTDPESKNPYMVMEFLQGEDLQQLLQRVGALSPDVAMRIVAQACIGLEKAHAAGVVHRDIKPANLFLARRDAGEVVVKLLDFGVAKVKMDQFASVEKAALTRTGAMIGSPLYMSPEQARGDKGIDGRTDLWSLGVVLYEALAGTTPNANIESMGGLILAICTAPPRPIAEKAPWLPPQVAVIVHKALELDPAARYGSAGEMLGAIRGLLPGGWAVQESMLAPLPPETRGIPSSAQPAAGFDATQSASPALAPTTTTAGTASVAATAPGRPVSRKRLVGLAVALGVLGLVGGRWMLAHKEPAASVPLSAVSDKGNDGVPSVSVQAPPPPATSPPAVAQTLSASAATPLAPDAAVAKTSAPPTKRPPAPAKTNSPLGIDPQVR
jgi:serine/threonine-protein kinase